MTEAAGESGTTTEARGVGVNLLTLLANASTPAFHVQLTRSLGTAGYGLYTTANSIVDVVSVFTLFGMDTVLAQRASVARQSGDEAAAVDAVAMCLRVVAVSGLMGGAVLMIGATRIAALQNEPLLAAPIRTLLLVPIAYHATSIFLIATQVRKVMKYDFWVRGVAQPLTVLGLTTLVLQLGAGLQGACTAVVATMTLTTALAALFYGRVHSLPQTLRRAVTAPWDSAVLRAGLPLVAMSLVAALRGRVDGLLVNFHRGPEDAGAFNVCLPYAATLFQIRGTFYPGLSGDLPAMIAAGRTDAMNALLRRQTRWVAMMALPFFMTLAGFGDAILAMHGQTFVRAHAALAVLAAGYLLSAMSLSSYALPLSGNARFNLYAALVSLGLQLFVPNLLIPRYGLLGGAISFFIALVVSEAICLTFARLRTGAQGFSLTLLKPVAASCVAWAAGRLAQSVAFSSAAQSPGRFLLGVGVALAFYILVLTSLGLESEDREIIDATLASVRARISRWRAGR